MNKTVFMLRVAIRAIAMIALVLLFIDVASTYSDYKETMVSSEGMQVLADQTGYLVYFAVKGVYVLMAGLAWIALEIALKGAKDDADIDLEVGGTVVTTADVKA